MKYLAYSVGVIFCTAQIFSFSVRADSETPTNSHDSGQLPSHKVSFDAGNWEIHAKHSKVEAYLGQDSLFLEEGKAFLKGVGFRDGILEYDVAFGEGRGFIGAGWRIQDHQNFEEFYLRPHQSGNPDASQYTPVFNGLSGWQLYSGNDYSAPVKHTFNQWTHIRIVFIGEIVKVYIQDMGKPAITSTMKHPRPESGGVSLLAGGGKAHFANFRYQDLNKGYPVDGAASDKVQIARAPNAVNTWWVSRSFNENLLSNTVLLTQQNKDGLTWQALKTDKPLSPKVTATVANLARVQGVEKDTNTAFARFKVTSEYDQVKGLQFGFSDRVRVYLNDTLMYVGDNTYRTRDYRFLGTIGFFDTVYMPLKKGTNEVWMAVSETFGGWGVQAQFTDAKGITIYP